MDISIILPCLNEEETVSACVAKALSGLTKTGLTGEVVVVDNGSSDRSAERAAAAGARVVREDRKGYGSAYLRGIAETTGTYVVFCDADDTYDLGLIPELTAPLAAGETDLVLGSRFKGTIAKGAMSFSHRYIGNPVLTGLLNLFYHSSLSDAHTGLRAVSRSALDRLSLKTTGMEFASEMIVAALRCRLRITEIPIGYAPRLGVSKLNSFADAWRHLRFLLLFSPTWLYLVPGTALFAGGTAAMVLAGLGRLVLFKHTWDIHAMVFFVLFSLLGSQIVMMGLYARAFSIREGFLQQDRFLNVVSRYVTIERGILAGFIIFFSGFATSLYLVAKWIQTDFIGPFFEIKLCLFSLFCTVIGIQIIFSSFFLSLLKMPRK